MVKVVNTCIEGIAHVEGVGLYVSKAARITLMSSKMAGILSLNKEFKQLFVGYETVSILWLTVKLLNKKI